MSENCCVNCSLPQKSGGIIPFSRLTTKLRNLNVTIADSLFLLFGLKIEDISNSLMCKICSAHLTSVYTSYIDFQKKKTELFNHTSSNSLLGQRVAHAMFVTTERNPRIPVEFEENFTQTDPIHLPKVRVLETIENARKNRRQRVILCNAIKKIVKKELEELTKTTCLRNEVKNDDNFIIDEFQEELVISAPIVNAVLEGMCPKRNAQKRVPKQLSILAIALISHSKFCNRFQKNIGIALRKMNASLQCFSMLNKLGLCCSVETAKKVLDSLSVDSNVIESGTPAPTDNSEISDDHSYQQRQRSLPNSLPLRSIPQQQKRKKRKKTSAFPLKNYLGIKRKKLDSEPKKCQGQDSENLGVTVKDLSGTQQNLNSIASLERKYKNRSEHLNSGSHKINTQRSKISKNVDTVLKFDLDLDAEPDFSS